MLRLREFPRALLRPHSRVSRPGPSRKSAGARGAAPGARFGSTSIAIARRCAAATTSTVSVAAGTSGSNGAASDPVSAA